MVQTLHRILVHVVFSTKDRVRQYIADRGRITNQWCSRMNLSLLRRHEFEYEERFLWR